MNGHDWKMCPWAGRPEIGLRMVVQTFPALLGWQGWPFRKEIASVEGFSGTSPEDVEKLRGCAVARLCGCVVVRLRGCAEGFTGAQLRGCMEDWGYIRPVADGESPFSVRPVRSNLFRPTRGRALGLWQPRLSFRHLMWTSLGDIRLSCIRFWWDTMSSETNLPMADQAGAAIVTTEALPGTFIGLGLD